MTRKKNNKKSQSLRIKIERSDLDTLEPLCNKLTNAAEMYPTCLRS
jgi:hypothetical protein